MRRRGSTSARAASAPAPAALPPSPRPPPPLARVSPFLAESNSALPWLFTPHTLVGLSVIVLAVTYAAFLLPAPQALHAEVAQDALRVRGVACACLVFLGYCALQLRDSLLVRPHPSLWRLVHGCGLLYLCGLVYMLAFPPEGARRLLRVLLPELDAATGAPLAPAPPEHNSKSYGEDCRIYTPGDAGGPFARVRESVDIFFVAHVVGWWAKGVFLRDWRLGWALSFTWEILEYSFQSILPNFIECWWDHWIEDFLLCNGLGLWLGMLTVGALNAKTYDWTGTDRDEPIARDPLSQARRLAWQFTPYEFARYEWRLFDSFYNFLAVALLITLLEVVELNAFVLKFVLYLPPGHPLNIARLALWFLLSLPATHEYYDYVTHVTGPGPAAVQRIGPNLWLAIAIAAAETLLSLKVMQDTEFRHGLPSERSLASYVPSTVVACWAVSLACFGVWCALKFAWRGQLLSAPARKVTLNALAAVSMASLVFLCYSQDVGSGLRYSAAAAH